MHWGACAQIRIRTYAFTHIRTCTYICTLLAHHTQMSTHTYITYIHKTYSHTHTHTHTHARILTRTHAQICALPHSYIRMYTCFHAYASAYLHVHAKTIQTVTYSTRHVHKDSKNKYAYVSCTFHRCQLRSSLLPTHSLKHTSKTTHTHSHTNTHEHR